MLVDLLHDLLSPLNACGDEFVSPWASLRPAEQIISSPHVQARQNRRHNPDYPFAAFVHVQKPFVFLSPLCYHSLRWVKAAFSTVAHR